MERRRDLLAIALVLGFTVSFALTNTTAGLAFIGGSDPLTVADARFTFTALALVVILRATGARFRCPDAMPMSPSLWGRSRQSIPLRF